MTTRGTMRMLTLGFVTVLMLSPMLLVSAYPGEEYENVREQAKNRHLLTYEVRNLQATRIRPFGLFPQKSNGDKLVNPTDIDSELESIPDDDPEELIEEIEGLPETETPEAKPFWVVWVRGMSWKGEEVTDVATADGLPIKMRALVKPIKHTERGTLYHLVRGILVHGDKTYRVTGKAVLTSDHTFAMKLEDTEGEEIEFIAIGRAWRTGFMYKVAMKGRMSSEGESWAFFMRGRAFRIRLGWIRSIAVRNRNRIAELAPSNTSNTN